jgi:hypothetical protein
MTSHLQKKEKTKHFFGPATFYYVKTICNPCGVVEAWAKFAKFESKSNILKFIPPMNHALIIFALIKVVNCLNTLLHKVTDMIYS